MTDFDLTKYDWRRRFWGLPTYWSTLITNEKRISPKTWAWIGIINLSSQLSFTARRLLVLVADCIEWAAKCCFGQLLCQWPVHGYSVEKWQVQLHGSHWTVDSRIRPLGSDTQATQPALRWTQLVAVAYIITQESELFFSVVTKLWPVGRLLSQRDVGWTVNGRGIDSELTGWRALSTAVLGI